MLMFVLTAWALALGLYDQARGRLPNLWLALGAVFALGWMLRYGQAPTGMAPDDALLGAGLAFALLIPGYVARQVGAGDVKYLAIIGLYLGPMGVLATAILGYAIMLGAFWARELLVLRATPVGFAPLMVRPLRGRPPLGLGLSLAFILQMSMSVAGTAGVTG